MSRIRTIKPDFWEDEKIGTLKMGCRLFFIGLWNQADDLGVFRNNPSVLKAKIFPFDDDLRISEIQCWLDALSKARMIVPISNNGESYYVIRTFRSHQRIDARYQNSLLSFDFQKAQKFIEKITTCTRCEHDVKFAQEVEVEVEIGSGSGSGVKNGGQLSFDFSKFEEVNIPVIEPETFKNEETTLNGEFAKAWQEWLEYRNDIKKPYKSQKSIDEALKDLKKYDEPIAIAMLKQSIKNGYQGFFEIKPNNYDKNNQRKENLTNRIYAESKAQSTGNK